MHMQKSYKPSSPEPERNNNYDFLLDETENLSESNMDTFLRLSATHRSVLYNSTPDKEFKTARSVCYDSLQKFKRNHAVSF